MTPEDLKAHGKVEKLRPHRGKLVGKLWLRNDADARTAPRRSYFWKGLAHPGDLGAVYGEPGSAKTFLATHIARCLPQGRELFGRRVMKAKVLYCALEGEGGFENRVKAAIDHYGVADGFAYIVQPINLFADLDAQTNLIAAVLEHKADVLVIDTMARAMAGGSENDPADMGKLIAILDTIRADTKAFVLLVHHSGKDASRGMRGHTALLGAADLVLEVTRSEGSSTRTVRVVKSKDGVDGDKFAFELLPINLGTDDDGDPITSCVVVETDVPAADRAVALKPEERQWYGELCELFAREDLTQKVIPEAGSSVARMAATRGVVRDWCRTRGLIGVAETVAESATARGLTATDRSKFSRMLNALKSKGKLGIHDDYIWLVQS